MTPLEKKKEKVAVRDYLRKHPDTGYEKLVAVLGVQSLSKPYFFNIRGALRKSGAIPGGNGLKREGRKVGGKRLEKPLDGKPTLMGTRIEILHTMDATRVTPELRQHWKDFVLPVLKELVPGGEGIRLVFLSDPPMMEIRKVFS